MFSYFVILQTFTLALAVEAGCSDVHNTKLGGNGPLLRNCSNVRIERWPSSDGFLDGYHQFHLSCPTMCAGCSYRTYAYRVELFANPRKDCRVFLRSCPQIPYTNVKRPHMTFERPRGGDKCSQRMGAYLHVPLHGR